MSGHSNNRILIVDDNPSIHEDYRKILAPRNDLEELAETERLLFGTDSSDGVVAPRCAFDLSCVPQGQDALQQVRSSLASNEPFALAFVDMRMPPGWDGLETIQRLWEVDPDLQVVICSAYSDYSWAQIVEAFGNTDRLLILKKPFEVVEVMQCATAMVHKWRAQREARVHLKSLDRMVLERTIELEQALEIMRAEAQERERMTNELRLAQKLESVGRLAAGIAHEINTPIQYVGDSMYFLQSTHEHLLKALDAYGGALATAAAGDGDVRLLWEQLQEGDSVRELQTLREEVPGAYRLAFEGMERVVGIVRAMKEFAHPGGSEQTLENINHAIETTLAVARNEYKYVATVDTELGDLPEVPCHLGELNQVFLNMIVNAAHAIGDAGREPQAGKIRIVTRRDDDWVQIEIQDNGCGIAAENLEKIYDPFFTTKEVGRGSGQGLAITRSIIVDKHGGRIRAQSQVGVGTSFFIQLPIHGRNSVSSAASGDMAAGERRGDGPRPPLPSYPQTVGSSTLAEPLFCEDEDPPSAQADELIRAAR